MLTLHFNSTELEVQENESSYRYRALMEKPQLVLKFSLPEFVEIPVGAWCEFQGEEYSLNSPENIKKNGTRNIEYTLTLGTAQDNLGYYKMRDPVDHRLKFSMTGKPKDFLNAIVRNLNDRDGSRWSMGGCIDAAEKTIEFNHAYIDAALQDVANAFETEWEINGGVISLHKVEYFKEAPLPLSYGKGNGFVPGVGRATRDDELPIKRLYVQGGERNIDPSKYKSKELLLPEGQTLDYKGRTYRADADGYYIERIDKVSDAVKEDSLDCSEIYPSRVGEVSAVETEEGKDTDGKPVTFYNIYDSSIPEELNYNDCRIAGETATIVFQSGMLAGKEFEIQQTKDALTGYDHEKREFKLVSTEIDGVTMPGGAYIPKVGDKYAVFGINLPQAYICDNGTQTGASWDMFKEAARKLYENEDPKFTFTGTLQGLWAKRNWVNVGGKLKVGGYILFSDEQFARDGIAIRITGIKDYISSPYTPQLEISNSVSGKSLSSKLREIEKNEVKTEDSIRDVVNYTKRRWRDSKETIGMLQDAWNTHFNNFTESINPLTVETMMILVGDESLQFYFVKSKTDPTIVGDGITYNNKERKLHINHGFIRHMTLGIKTLSSSHKPEEYKTWEMEEFESAYLGDPDKKYYLYAKVSSTNTDEIGHFLLSETPIDMNSEEGYYYLLTGILNSEYDGTRSFVTLYGFTEILPGRITTDKIVSSDGNTYFDLLRGIISGRIKFTSGSSGLYELDEWSEVDKMITDVQTNTDKLKKELGTLDSTVDSFQEFVEGAFADGIITEAEKVALEKNIRTIETTEETVKATYEKLIENSYLAGIPKEGLETAYGTLSEKIKTLKDSIRNAIEDNKITDDEDASVDTAFIDFNTAISAFYTAVEVANEAIQNALKKYSDEALKAAQDAAKAAQNAAESAEKANTAVEDLNGYVDEAFKDGVIEEAEAKAIEKYINTVNATKAAVEATYEKLYANAYLTGTAKTGLSKAKDAFSTAISSLITSINTAIKDGKTTAEEKADVDVKYDAFNKAYAAFNTAVEVANEAIQDALKKYSDEALKAAQDAAKAAQNAAESAEKANTAVEDLNGYVDEAFKDGVIEEAEAKAIEKYINTVNATKAAVEATYEKLYANAYLTGTAKTGLSKAKDAFSTAISSLITSINTAIKDGKTTAEEKADVDVKYDAFNKAYAAFNTAVEVANEAIQDALKKYSDEALSQANTALESAKNAMAKDLGYADFADLEKKAEAAETLIVGGKINTTLIDAEAIVTNALLTSGLLAEWIKTKELEAENLTVTGKSKIAGLKISGDSLTNEGFDNDAYIILRNDLHKVFAGIGGNMLPVYSGLRAVARFENEESNGFWGGTNIAMIVRASGAEKNRAIIATGDILTKGLNIGYSFHEYSFTADNQWQKPSILKSDILYVYFNHSNCVFVLPTLREVCDSLDIDYSTQFAFRLTIISSAGSGKLCGRNNIVQGTSGNEYPQLRKPDGGIDSSGYNISENDSFEVCLFYLGGNSYIPTAGDAYRAYITSISR